MEKATEKQEVGGANSVANGQEAGLAEETPQNSIGGIKGTLASACRRLAP